MSYKNLKNEANYQPLSPISFLFRTAEIFPDYIAWIYEKKKCNYAKLLERTKKLANSLRIIGVKKGDVVSVMLPNVPSMIEAHFGVPMAGAILNTINTRLEKTSIEYIIKHSRAKVFIFHEDFYDLVLSLSKEALSSLKLICVYEQVIKSKKKPILLNYETFLKGSLKSKTIFTLKDEWEAISLNYTSGTTGKPKGVLYHHRGAYLMCFNNQMVWKMNYHPVYLWTLPMFHCNGWCFPWTIVALAGTQVCMRKTVAKDIVSLINRENITHFCGAPIILQMIINELKKIKIKNKVKIMTAASPPPPNILEKIEKKGFEVTHVYGLTESYGPAVVCEWKSVWNKIKSSKRKAILKARQGVKYPSLEFLDVKIPETMTSVRRNGKTLGEVMFKGNIIMKGYLNDNKANKAAFKNSWFHTGDLAVIHKDGYIELKDRSKDIIISGGENISSIEIEKIILQHEQVIDCAVIGINDIKWGEVPCAFVETTEKQISEKNIIDYCKKYLAGFKLPKKVIFMPLPRTSTGKVQKFSLRKIVSSSDG